jgi:hypothetical protein
MKKSLILMFVIAFVVMMSGCTTIEDVVGLEPTETSVVIEDTSTTSRPKQEEIVGVITDISLLNSTVRIKVNYGDETKEFLLGQSSIILDESYNRKSDPELSVGCHVKIEYDKEDSDNIRININKITILSYDGIFVG